MQREHLGARAAQPEEDGFTLLELMMVILIIGILIAVLTPTLLRSRLPGQGPRDAIEPDDRDHGGEEPLPREGRLHDRDSRGADRRDRRRDVRRGRRPRRRARTRSPCSPVSDRHQLVLAGQSKSGSCFYVLDDETAGTTVVREGARCRRLRRQRRALPGDPAWQADLVTRRTRVSRASRVGHVPASPGV